LFQWQSRNRWNFPNQIWKHRLVKATPFQLYNIKRDKKRKESQKAIRKNMKSKVQLHQKELESII
jgi:hypothetical protein